MTDRNPLPEKRAGLPWLDGLRRRWGGRRFRLTVLLTALAASLLLVAVVAYAQTLGRSAALGFLPSLDALGPSVAPRFLFSINGTAKPLGVAVSSSGDRVYVTESDGERLTRVFDRDGKPVGTLSPPDTQPTSRNPVYVAVSSDGRVYISDRRLATIHVYSPAGAYLGQVTSPEGAGGAWAPLGLGFDAQGDLMVTDVTPGRHGVWLLRPDGTLLRHFGREGAGDGEFSYPNAVVVDQEGRILVSDSNNGRVGVLSPEGAPLFSFGRGLGAQSTGLPRGLAVDERNRAYVVDAVSHVVLVFEVQDSGAKQLFTLGSQGSKDGEFSYPNGIALDRAGRLYITDRENNRVQVWTSK